MPDSTPIRTTGAVYWRQFRHQAAPYLVFAAVLVAAVLIWHRRVGHSTIVGRAEAVHIPVSPRKSGVVMSLKVDVLQPVHRGDILAEVVPADADAIRAGLTANLEAMRAQMLQNADRNTVNFQEFRVDWLRRKLELASAQVDLQLAETEFRRISALHDSKIVSESDFDAKRGNRDALQVKVETLTRLTNEMEQEMLNPRNTANASAPSPADRAVAAATDLLEKQLAAQADATVLRAPMDGIVTTIHHRVGENAFAGEPVITIGALRPERIVAFMRQPLRLHLRQGDSVQVSVRGTRVTKPARVIQVGAQLEPIDPVLLPTPVMTSRISEYGLPLLIEIPPELGLAPGEMVVINAAPSHAK